MGALTKGERSGTIQFSEVKEERPGALAQLWSIPGSPEYKLDTGIWLLLFLVHIKRKKV